MALLIGLDLGTTHFKALAVSEEGAVRAAVSTSTPATDEGEGRVVYDPDAVWESVVELLRTVRARAGSEPVAGVACASMGEAGFLLDSEGMPLGPALAWFDPRTRPLEERWSRKVSLERIRAITGLQSDFTYTLHKILWWKLSHPELFTRARHWLGMSEYVAYRLCGEMGTDFSLASRTMALDLAREEWSEELLSAGELPHTLLPPVVPAGTRLGTVNAQLARATGLSPGAIVAAGGHDHICAALAVGAVGPRVLLNSCGTAETMLAAVAREALPRALAEKRLVVGHHLFAGTYYAMASLRTSGLSADWFVREMLTGPDNGHAAFAERARVSPPGARGLLFYPYLRDASDERHGAGSAGVMLGLRDFHTNADLARALIEGLAFESRRMLERLGPMLRLAPRAAGATGSPPVLRAVGGGTANPTWMQVKADVLELPIQVPAVQEATAYGAALLAGLGAGTFRDASTLPGGCREAAQRYAPHPERQRVYRSIYQRYLSLLPAVVGLTAAGEVRQSATGAGPAAEATPRPAAGRREVGGRPQR